MIESGTHDELMARKGHYYKMNLKQYEDEMLENNETGDEYHIRKVINEYESGKAKLITKTIEELEDMEND